MAPISFTAEDHQNLRARGVTEEAIRSQIAIFEQGIPFTVLDRPCTVGDGILVLQSDELERLAVYYTQAALAGRTMKFIPASGAASRMFKLLLSFMSRPQHPDPVSHGSVEDAEEQEFRMCMRRLRDFAFYDDLRLVMSENGLDIEQLSAQEQFKEILEYLLLPKGLNSANLPKALLKFHRYPDHCRTPLEEHLVEASAYAQDENGTARLHFTVTPVHSEAMSHYLKSIRQRYEQDGARLDVSFSTQKPSSDTIAVDLQNRPFRDARGQLLFRPAGHGALLANLQDLHGDIVFIKNIDNVVPDRLKAETYLYKRALGGYLTQIQERVFAYLRQMESGAAHEELLDEVFAFTRNTLSVVPPPGIRQQTVVARGQFLFRILNRPLRICGMVKNVGEPGGGPFWVQEKDGSLSLQIVETSQVNMQDEQQRHLVANATHFNPVDLVCGVGDYRGEPFDLSQFTDPDTGFISTKSHDGQELKALELPGLWNGAMARWNTVFVEVPLETFNPVKTVMDLLRPQHQPM